MRYRALDGAESRSTTATAAEHHGGLRFVTLWFRAVLPRAVAPLRWRNSPATIVSPSPVRGTSAGGMGNVRLPSCIFVSHPIATRHPGVYEDDVQGRWSSSLQPIEARRKGTPPWPSMVQKHPERRPSGWALWWAESCHQETCETCAQDSCTDTCCASMRRGCFQWVVYTGWWVCGRHRRRRYG